MDEGPVEAGGLWVERQNQLVFTEQGLRVGLRVGLPLGEGDDPPPAQSVSPATHTTVGQCEPDVSVCVLSTHSCDQTTGCQVEQ